MMNICYLCYFIVYSLFTPGALKVSQCDQPISRAPILESEVLLKQHEIIAWSQCTEAWKAVAKVTLQPKKHELYNRASAIISHVKGLQVGAHTVSMVGHSEACLDSVIIQDPNAIIVKLLEEIDALKVELQHVDRDKDKISNLVCEIQLQVNVLQNIAAENELLSDDKSAENRPRMHISRGLHDESESSSDSSSTRTQRICNDANCSVPSVKTKCHKRRLSDNDRSAFSDSVDTDGD